MEQDVEGYVSYSDKVQRLTYDDLDVDDVTINVLNDRSQQELMRKGLDELFPV